MISPATSSPPPSPSAGRPPTAAPSDGSPPGAGRAGVLFELPSTVSPSTADGEDAPVVCPTPAEAGPDGAMLTLLAGLSGAVPVAGTSGPAGGHGWTSGGLVDAEGLASSDPASEAGEAASPFQPGQPPTPAVSTGWQVPLPPGPQGPDPSGGPQLSGPSRPQSPAPRAAAVVGTQLPTASQPGAKPPAAVSGGGAAAATAVAQAPPDASGPGSDGGKASGEEPRAEDPEVKEGGSDAIPALAAMTVPAAPPPDPSPPDAFASGEAASAAVDGLRSVARPVGARPTTPDQGPDAASASLTGADASSSSASAEPGPSVGEAQTRTGEPSSRLEAAGSKGGPALAAEPALTAEPAVSAEPPSPAGPQVGFGASGLSLSLPPGVPGNPTQPGAASHPVASGVPIAAVPVEIGMRSLEGISRFEIRLSPEELGGIDVRLDIAADGRVSAHLLVDRRETLVWLQRDSAQLERALDQAGLRPQEGGVSMALRDSGAQWSGAGGQQSGAGDPGAGRTASQPDRDGERTTPGEAGAAAPRRVLWSRASGIDLRI